MIAVDTARFVCEKVLFEEYARTAGIHPDEPAAAKKIPDGIKLLLKIGEGERSYTDVFACRVWCIGDEDKADGGDYGLYDYERCTLLCTI